MYRITIILMILSISLIPLYGQEKPANGTGKLKEKKIELAKEPAVIIDGRRITLSQALVLAMEKSPDFKRGKYEVAMAFSGYEMFQKKYSPFLSASSSAKKEKSPPELQIFNGTESKTVDTGVSLAKMFSTGTTVAAGLKHIYSKKEFEYGELPVIDRTDPANENYFVPMAGFGSPEYHMPAAFVSIEQELLKNAFGYCERRQARIMKNVGEIRKQAILAYLSGAVIKVIADYWGLVIKLRTLTNAKLLLKETKKVRRIVTQNVKIGLSERFELNYYNVLVASAEASVTGSEQAYKDALREFLQLLTIGKNIKIEDGAVFSIVTPKINKVKATATALSKRADYKYAVLNQKNAEMELEIYENEAMPSVTAGFSIASMGQDKDIGKAYSDTGSLTYPVYEASVRVTYPLDDREQKTKYRNAKYKLEQANIILEKKHREVEDDVESKIENIASTFKIYEKMRNVRIESEKYYNRFVQSLRRGRFSSAAVKNALDALVQSKIAELGSLIRFNIALLEFNVAKNDLFERYNIDVEKYIPKD